MVITAADDQPGGDAARGKYRPTRPDDLLEFRLGRLLLLLGVVAQEELAAPDIERLAVYDFFAANPFLVLEQDRSERVQAVLAGFDSRNLSYHSSSHRFTNRRARLQHDLSVLVSRGTVGVEVANGRVTYRSTSEGRDVAGSFRALYADAFRRSASVIVRRLARMSDALLARSTREWLRAESFLIDLYDEPGRPLNQVP